MNSLADQDRVPLLVLDEIDAEIGGRMGLAIGKKLHEVARHHQLVIVTHLAPVAAFAQHHFLVNKVVGGSAGDERTSATVRQLAAGEVEKGTGGDDDGGRRRCGSVAAGAATGREGEGRGRRLGSG
jgi:DNA repair protein RecN (Recombination protein N)